MKVLNEDIKSKQFKAVYLLCGEEEYLKRQYKQRLREAIIPADDTINYAFFEGKQAVVGQIIDLAETLPFFTERRLIIVENSGFFKKGGADLADYLKNMPTTSCLVFIEQEIDKRSKLYKTVSSQGHIEEFAFQDESTLKKWVAGLIKKENKQINAATIDFLIQKVGTNMDNIFNEIEKLFCYTYSRDVILGADVEAVCTTQISNHIFEMIEAVSRGNQAKALSLYYELLALKEAPLGILFLLTRQYRLIIQAKAMVALGRGKAQVAKDIGVHPFAAGKYMEQSRRYNHQQLVAVLNMAASFEEKIKTGLLQDKIGVELFIIQNT